MREFDETGRRKWSALVVDDEFFIAFDLEERLRRLGADDVRSACTLADAMASMSEWTPTLAIVDWRLAGSTPVKLIEQLLARAVRVVISSGSHRSEIDQAFGDRVLYVQKPVSDEALDQAVLLLLPARRA
ncbi:MAG: response regulator [Hyphomicrobiales bacterium]|nr:response regulator [Hyphomicrobiales bacterium]